MYLKEYLNKFKDKNIKLYVDMDGVIVDYVVGDPNDFSDRRPLKDSLKKLEDISSMPNVELYVLSVTRYDTGYDEKHEWLDKFAPFFKKENRIILSRESNNMERSYNLKSNYLNSINKDDSIFILIDDDPKVLETLMENNKDIILLKDTALVD